MGKIPRFRSLEMAAKFWDTHDFEDFIEDTKPVTVAVTIPRRRKTLKVPIDLKVYRQIEAVAAKRRVRAETIVSRWLRERARKESATR